MKKVLLALLSLGLFSLGVFFLDTSANQKEVLGEMTTNIPVKIPSEDDDFDTSSLTTALVSSDEDDSLEASVNKSSKETTAVLKDMTAPSGLSAIIEDASTVALRWNTSSDASGSISYRVFRDGSVIGSTSETSYVDKTVKVGKKYAYAVAAIDSMGNISSKSDVITVKVNAAAENADEDVQSESFGTVTYAPSKKGSNTAEDTQVPTAPQKLMIEAISPTVARVRWQASTDNVGVANYRVFRNGTHIGSTDKTYYDDITVEPGKQYEYFIKARDIAKNESAKSAIRGIIMPLLYEKADEPAVQEKPVILTVGTEPDPTKIVSDADGDGMSDAEEARLGTNSEVADTDGDGFKDGDEIRGGFDPLKYSPGDKSDRIVFESPKDAPEKKKEREDKRFAVEKVERVISAKNSAPVIKISGKGTPNSYVTVYIYSNPIIVVVKTDEEGNWQYELDRDLEDGDHEVYVAVTDNLGRITAQSSPLPFVKTAQAITVRPETLPAQAVKENQSPLDQLFSQYVGIGVVIALLFIFVVVAIIRSRFRPTIEG